MFFDIVRFEWRYHTRRLTFAAAAMIFLLVGFMSTARSRPALDVHINAPYSLAFALGLLSLASVFTLTLFCAQAVLRDSEHQMAEIVYTTAVTKARYLLSSYAGVLTAAGTVFLFALFGMILGTVIPDHDPSLLGGFDILDYLWPFSVLIVPNMLLVGAVLFTISALTRSTLATYVSGILLYMLYVATAMLTDSPLIAMASPPTPEGMAIAALVDPFGLSAFFEQTHYWTTQERNELRIAFAGRFLINRLLWTGAAALILAILYRRFAFRLPRALSASRRDRGEVPTNVSPYRPIPSSTRSIAALRALRSAVRLELALILKSRPFLVLMLLWIGMNAIEIAQFVHHGEYGTLQVPTTALLIQRIQDPLTLIGILAVIFYSAEMVWRERSVGIDQIVDTTSSSEAVFVIAKTIALIALIATMTVVAAIVGLVSQLISGYIPLNALAYASLLYFVGMPLSLFAVLAIFLQTVSANRHIGMFATLATIICLSMGAFGWPQHPAGKNLGCLRDCGNCLSVCTTRCV